MNNIKRHDTTARNKVAAMGWTARSRMGLNGKLAGWVWFSEKGQTVVSTEVNFLKSAEDVIKSTVWGGV